jgi:Cof subfamily protein (haloacid dehalogenase superfamily)
LLNNSHDLVAIDVDGTLLDPHGRLCPGAKDAIEKAQAQGLRVTLASGRARITLVDWLEMLAIDQPFVAFSGAYIEDAVSGRVIDHVRLRSADAVTIVRLAREFGVSPLYNDLHCLYAELQPGHEQVLVEDERASLKPVQDLLRDAPGPPTTMAVLGEEQTVQQFAGALLRATDHVHVVRPFAGAVDISRRGVSKGTALTALASHLGIPLHRVAAIGDADNDRSMFEVAGLAIAMGNAPRQVRVAVDVVAPTNVDGGVAWALERLLDGGLVRPEGRS